MLKVNDIHTYYGDSYIIQGVSLEIGEGSVVALLGRNGMGKTTTIKSVMGFNPPRRGTIEFKGRDICKLPSHEIARTGIGLVPQGRRIFPSLSVEENLTIARRDNHKDDPWTIEDVYELFPKLKERSKNRGNLLSGGEQQMLAIGRALMTNPDLMLLDEPSEGLAPIIVQEVGRIIARLKTMGISILLVEQNINMALRVADYVYIIDKGKIVYESSPDALRMDEEAKAKYLGIHKKTR
jgi:branched-chain amino acid transport system ATP-binding protein